MDVRMDGRVAVITGASTGLGLAMAKEFAASGASVALLARKQDALAAAKAEVQKAAGKANIKIEAYSCDVAKAAPIADTFKKIEAEFGKVDIVVNNAGISHAKSFETVTDEDWQGDLDLKLFAAIRLIRHALPSMKARGGGRIVNVTNIGAKQPGAGTMPTTVSRAAGLAMTKAHSREYAPHGILVNTVCIGLVRAGQHEARAARQGIDPEALYAQMAASVPLGRVGEADEAADVILFLVSRRASFVTGSSINIDGGASAVF